MHSNWAFWLIPTFPLKLQHFDLFDICTQFSIFWLIPTFSLKVQHVDRFGIFNFNILMDSYFFLRSPTLSSNFNILIKISTIWLKFNSLIPTFSHLILFHSNFNILIDDLCHFAHKFEQFKLVPNLHSNFNIFIDLTFYTLKWNLRTKCWNFIAKCHLIVQNVEIWVQRFKSIKMMQFEWKSKKRSKSWNLSAKC